MLHWTLAATERPGPKLMLVTLSSVGAGGLGGSEDRGNWFNWLNIIRCYFEPWEQLRQKLSLAIVFKKKFLTSAGVNVSTGRGETSCPSAVDGRHPELVPAARPNVDEPSTLLGRLRDINKQVPVNSCLRWHFLIAPENTQKLHPAGNRHM